MPGQVGRFDTSRARLVLILICRAVPITQPARPVQCSETYVKFARNSLVIHRKSWEKMASKDADTWIVLAHFSVLYYPFILITRLLSNIIVSANADDLILLDQIAATPESTARLSEGFARIQFLCTTFCNLGHSLLIQTERSAVT